MIRAWITAARIAVLGLFWVLAAAQQKRDPAAWGGNHAGQPIPEFVHGDECLFCHRNDIGPGWQKNAHGVTIRKREDAPELIQAVEKQPALAGVAAQIEYVLGSRQRLRFLKKRGYGKFALFSGQLVLGRQNRVEMESQEWDQDRFADRCAGCHATAVDASTKAFAAYGLDCYTCHGAVPLEHSTDTSKVWLSRKRRTAGRAITSICAQCHLRGGQSRSTGLPYPNNFVAGDNLFQDFQVDFSRAEDPSLNPGDRHVLRNVRDVAVRGVETLSCLNCHQVHANSSARHRRVLRAPICFDCHAAEGPFQKPRAHVVASPTCEY